MMGSVLFSSVFPLTLVIGNASASPFLFVALINFSSVITGLIFLVWFHHTQKENQTVRETLRTIRSKIYSKAFFWLSIARFQDIFFALSLAYINVAVASILAAIKPLVVVLFTSLLFKKIKRYQKITKEKWLLFFLSFIGGGFVIASQSENFRDIAGDLLNQGAIIGVLLVLLSALIGGMGSPYSLKLGSDISKETGGGATDELFFTIAFMFVVWVVASVSFFTAAVLTNESFADINILPAIVFGFAAQGMGMIIFRVAHIKTNNLGINALGYATPVLVLIWLGIFSLIDVPHFDWLMIGTSAIILANLLLNFKTNIRSTHKVIIIVLWLFASVAYLALASAL